MLSLTAEIDFDESKIPTLRQFLENVERVAWLDPEKEWLYLPESPRNRLVNLASKVLSVSPIVRLAELRRAVGRSRRLAMVPHMRLRRRCRWRSQSNPSPNGP